nr:xyloglucan endotransglucosylase/hydrolase 2-like [Tanacetum cinerariifolium]
MDITFGGERANILDGGQDLSLSLDQYSGSGFKSKHEYLFGRFDMQLRLYLATLLELLPHFTYHHKVLDMMRFIFEYLGNSSGNPYTVHTNVYSKGKVIGKRRNQYKPIGLDSKSVGNVEGILLHCYPNLRQELGEFRWYSESFFLSSGITIQLRSKLLSFGIRAMETRNSTELKKILDTMEADKRYMAQQMKAMQDQIQELLNSQTHGEDSNSHGSVNKEGSSGWRSNDIKVDIPKYDGKLDPDEFVEWIRTVERVFDYKETTDDNKVKIVALKAAQVCLNMVVQRLFEARANGEGKDPNMAKDES